MSHRDDGLEMLMMRKSDAEVDLTKLVLTSSRSDLKQSDSDSDLDSDSESDSEDEESVI